MHCPRCQQTVAEAASSCEGCGLSMTVLDRRFGVVPRHFQEVTDLVGFFSVRARARLRRHLHLLHGRFPQVRFSLFACDTPNRPARSYGFWLFNRCRFHSLGSTLGRCFSLLLVFNRADRSVSLTGGYGLERICHEEDLQAFLESAAQCWRDGDFEKGTLIVLRELTAHLKAVASVPATPTRSVHLGGQLEGSA